MSSTIATTVPGAVDRLSTLIPELRTEIFRLAIFAVQVFINGGLIDVDGNITRKIHPLAQVNRQLRQEILPLLFWKVKYGWGASEWKMDESWDVESMEIPEILKRHREQAAKQLDKWLLSFGEGLRFVDHLVVVMPPISDLFDCYTSHATIQRTWLDIVVKKHTFKAVLRVHSLWRRLEIGARPTEEEAVGEAMLGIEDMIKRRFEKYGRFLMEEPGVSDGKSMKRCGVHLNKKQADEG